MKGTTTPTSWTMRLEPSRPLVLPPPAMQQRMKQVCSRLKQALQRAAAQG